MLHKPLGLFWPSQEGLRVMDDKQGNGQSGGVRITGGNVQAQNIAGRDINVVSQIARSDLDQLFHPVIEAIRSGPGERTPAFLRKVQRSSQRTCCRTPRRTSPTFDSKATSKSTNPPSVAA